LVLARLARDFTIEVRNQKKSAKTILRLGKPLHIASEDVEGLSTAF